MTRTPLSANGVERSHGLAAVSRRHDHLPHTNHRKPTSTINEYAVRNPQSTPHGQQIRATAIAASRPGRVPGHPTTQLPRQNYLICAQPRATCAEVAAVQNGGSRAAGSSQSTTLCGQSQGLLLSHGAPPASSKSANRFRLVRAEASRRPRPMRSEAGWPGVPSTTAACPWLSRDGPRRADGRQTRPLDRIITAGPRLWRSRWSLRCRRVAG